jgi:vacuolar-type H+-ATPase subunit E/Vma4
VVTALLDDAGRRAEAVQSAASRDGAQLEARAASDAEALVGQAAAIARAAAQRAAALSLGAARRQGRALVLEARRRAFERLRARAVDLLDERLRRTPEGRAAAAGLADAVATRLDVPVSAVEEEPGAPFALRAGVGRRQISVGAADLVDGSMQAVLDTLTEMWR